MSFGYDNTQLISDLIARTNLLANPFKKSTMFGCVSSNFDKLKAAVKKINNDEKKKVEEYKKNMNPTFVFITFESVLVRDFVV